MLTQIDANDKEDAILAITNGTKGSQELAASLQALADYSREELDIRQRLAQEVVLRALVERASPTANSQDDLEVQHQALRCIGNACAANPTAICTVCDIGLQWLQQYCKQQPEVLSNVIIDTLAGVTYNLLAADFTSDGEERERENPALKACYNAGVHEWIIALVTSMIETKLSKEDLVDMLFWLSACASNDVPALSQPTVAKLLSHTVEITTSLAAETASTWVEATVSLMRPPTTRATLAEGYDISPLFHTLQSIESRIATCQASEEPQSAEDLSILVPQSSNLTWLLSDISAEPSFAKDVRLTRNLLGECKQRLKDSTTSDQIFIAASLISGNAALNLDESETVALIDSGIADSTTKRLSAAASSDLLFAGAGLLSSLCRPKSSREKLGTTTDLLIVVNRLCKSEMPQISQAGLRLVRKLGRECPVNQARLAPILECLPQPTQAATVGS